VRLWNAVIDKDWDTALDLHERLMPLWDAIGVDNMPSLCKYAQQLQGLDAGVARRPTSPATEEQKQLVRSALKNLDLI
jgi:4-hydroxy-tetrahydrodipicolinate synthase